MALEIERKFLVSDPAWRAAAAGRSSIVQFYVIVDADRSLRVRIRDDVSATMTVKIGEGARRREEFIYPLPLADALSMRDAAIGRVLKKIRHLVAWRGRIFEIDEFAGPLVGLVVAELETEDEVPDVDLPPWLGPEVTDDRRYLNVNLALDDGGPPA